MILKLVQLINDNTKNFNEIYQAKVTAKIHFYNIKCPYCKHNSFISYGSYTRNILVNGDVQKVAIHRVFCKECERTHALMTLDIIPYCYIDQRTAFTFFKDKTINVTNELLKEVLLRNLLNRVRLLKGHYLNAFKDAFEHDDISKINEAIVKTDFHSFLQIHRGKIYLGYTPT